MTSTTRRMLLGAASAAALGCPAMAQQFPSRPIRLILGYGAGGGTDNLARLYARAMQEVMGVPIVVENRPGASESLAIAAVKAARPDGHTLWMGTGGALANGPGVRRDLTYDVLQDFTPIALLSEADAVLLVRASLPIRSFTDLLAYARANPGKLNYGSGGVGSGNHLQLELMTSATGVSMTHIPYRSDAEVIQAVMSGNVDLTLILAQFALPYIADRAMFPLAVTGSERMPQLATVPTFGEAGGAELRGMGSYTFFGLLGPAGMPEPIVQALNEGLNKVAVRPDVDQALRERLLYRPIIGTSAAFRDYLAREIAKWRELGQKANIVIQ